VDSIKRARKAAGMSLAQVSQRCGLLPETIARAERAGIDPKASTVARIAKALGVPVCELYEKTGHERRKAKKTAKPRR
jgi:transcriptional regulator with XRE-family HTH domain